MTLVTQRLQVVGQNRPINQSQEASRETGARDTRQAGILCVMNSDC